jgi:hypothetical protein
MTPRTYTNRRYLDALEKKVLVFDGAMGTSLQTQNLTAEHFGGEQYNGCNDFLVISYPEAVEKVHRSFLEVGVDVLETDTFRSNRLTLGEYGLGERTIEINVAAAQLARRLADEYSGVRADGHPPQPRFVAGSIGPSGKLPSADDPELSNMQFDELADLFREQAVGLIQGGVDVILIETSQDILEVKAAITASPKPLKKPASTCRFNARLPSTPADACCSAPTPKPPSPSSKTCHRCHRPELLHRPRAHARTDSHPRRRHAPARFVHPQRRAAAQCRWTGRLSARAGTVFRRVNGIRDQKQHLGRRRLLRHHARAPETARRKVKQLPAPSPSRIRRAQTGFRHQGHDHAARPGPLPDWRTLQRPGQPRLQTPAPGRRLGLRPDRGPRPGGATARTGWIFQWPSPSAATRPS